MEELLAGLRGEGRGVQGRAGRRRPPRTPSAPAGCSPGRRTRTGRPGGGRRARPRPATGRRKPERRRRTAASRCRSGSAPVRAAVLLHLARVGSQEAAVRGVAAPRDRPRDRRQLLRSRLRHRPGVRDQQQVVGDDRAVDVRLARPGLVDLLVHAPDDGDHRALPGSLEPGDELRREDEHVDPLGHLVPLLGRDVGSRHRDADPGGQHVAAVIALAPPGCRGEPAAVRRVAPPGAQCAGHRSSLLAGSAGPLLRPALRARCPGRPPWFPRARASFRTLRPRAAGV